MTLSDLEQLKREYIKSISTGPKGFGLNAFVADLQINYFIRWIEANHPELATPAGKEAFTH